MADFAQSEPDTPRQPASVTPSIAVTDAAGLVIAGARFLPNHDLTIRVDYIADGASDYLAFTTDSTGNLHAALPTTATTGTLRITATDHRPDTTGECGLAWSNTEIIDSCER